MYLSEADTLTACDSIGNDTLGLLKADEDKRTLAEMVGRRKEQIRNTRGERSNGG